ncbi:NADP-dependent oxidoreductase [Nocardiopsis sp. NPDC049922]|uniref:NADP-dependent oxidoreductase n=1 Tax=Nocardiopsis sp. NPDC049922 TaxID=3155157 RepID=UPI0034067B7A
MRAVAFHRPGPPDVLEVLDLPDPDPGPGQVRVRVRAAGVQPVDTAIRRGVRLGFEVASPQVLGNDFAGTVDVLGEGVNAVAVGDAVLGWSLMACYAEFVVVGVDQIVPRPEGMPWEHAGVFASSGQTAHTALRTLRVGEGDTVLVHAAAGGVGTFAVQMARAWGATVLGTCGAANADHVRALGAVPVRHGEGLADRVRAVAPAGVDAALDMVGGQTLRTSAELVKDRERVGTIVDYPGAAELGVVGIRSRRSVGRLREIVELYERGALRVHVSRAFPLEEAAEAHRVSELRRTRGKLALIVAE